MLELREFIRDIPDFPKPGILFRDITPMLASAKAFRECIRRLADRYRDRKVDTVIAAEARIHFRRTLGRRAGNRICPGSKARQVAVRDARLPL